MRYVAPARDRIDPAVFGRMPLLAWREDADLLAGTDWPSIEALNRRWPGHAPQRFVAQTPALLADGLHYEQRIAECGQVATRENNWHDLFNALVWLRYPALKQALNRRQMDELKLVGPKQRSRAQYAMTHFDEGGVIVAVSDPGLLGLWDAHDWHGLFWRRRQAWLDGSITLRVFGHALLELALNPDKLLVGKAVVVQSERVDMDRVQARCVARIAGGQWLNDPLELRPLPLSGVPGWHPANADESFHLTTICYQARRAGRCYPPPASLQEPAGG